MPQNGELYIRYSTTDHGERDIPAGTSFWESPAIEILGSGLGAGTAVADVDQIIRVYVGNRSPTNAFTDVRVQVYATDWGTTNPWLASVGGDTGREIGPQTVVANARWDPLPGTEGVFEVGWRPDVSELGGLAHKHLCLMANCYAAGDGAAQSVPPVFSDIPTNQHHAQRNITLSATAFAAPMGFGFQAANIGAEGETFLLEVAEVRARRLTRVEAFQLAGTDWLRPVQEKLGKPLAMLEPLTDLRLEAQGQKGRRLKLGLEAGEQVPVTLRAEAVDSDQAGLRRFVIVQRVAGSREIVGGARLLIAALPRDLIPEPLLRDAVA